jgi:dolichyl-diphosphooligosaccharide--protein glycosyltransferase
MSYYRCVRPLSGARSLDSAMRRSFNDLFGGQPAQDRVRNQRLPKVGPELDTLDEAFTSENWIVRIYKVKREDELARDLRSAGAFKGGKRRKRVRAARRVKA